MKTKMRYLLLIIPAIIALALAACGGNADAPAQTVELYHQALVDKDQDRLINYSCAAWEMDALLELDSFVSVETSLVDVSCATISEESGTAKVQCEGIISASYDGEAREFPLNTRTFIVVEEGGEWRVCGYE